VIVEHAQRDWFGLRPAPGAGARLGRTF